MSRSESTRTNGGASMSRRICIVDTETTSLKPDYETGTGVIWELAVIERGLVESAGDVEHIWRMEPDASKAAPEALSVGRFYERTEGTYRPSGAPANRVHELSYPLAKGGHLYWSDPAQLAPVVARLLDGTTFVAANPAFDAGFLTAFLNAHGQAATWHYRLRDIGSMAFGAMARLPGADLVLPMDASTDDFARLLGVDPEQFERHSALGDVRLVAAMLGVIEGAS